ncbi:MAG: hypothetical protein ACR2IA_08985 [Pyrinomonadaceae bacterium]
MQKLRFAKPVLSSVLFSAVVFSIGCQPQTSTTNANLVNTNANMANSFANGSNANSTNMNSSVSSSAIETGEPEQYEAKVTLRLEAIGDGQKTTLPTITANVARNGAERRMELTLPNGEKVIYLDKAGTNYAILPNRKQYAELNQETLGFDVRQMLLPEQIVQRVKGLQGVQLVGDEQMNGRTVTKYRYGSVANTQSQAGQVATESFLIVDKETGLPLRSETVVQSQSGGNVQGYSGMRVITEMSDIKTTVDPAVFAAPTEFQKVEAEQVRAQANLIFNVVGQLIGQMMNQANPASSPMASPMMSPSPQG